MNNEMFACRTDWYRLPRTLRNAIWRAYNAGGGPAHVEAMAEAIDWFRQNPRPARKPVTPPKPVDPQLF